MISVGIGQHHELEEAKIAQGNGIFCKLAGVVVPAEIVAVGCEAYEFDPNSPPF
jgi:hypothetical protein